MKNPESTVRVGDAVQYSDMANVPVVYLDANGNPIELDNGLTWVHVIGSQKWHGGL